MNTAENEGLTPTHRAEPFGFACLQNERVWFVVHHHVARHLGHLRLVLFFHVFVAKRGVVRDGSIVRTTGCCIVGRWAQSLAKALTRKAAI
jgi:hypothetical protein